MKLRRLYLHGFKSFADRTELRFHDGITAIVGPNGCGKSNISDAVRWVLGEQRASAIRGAKMEEAIFQGTTERRALNRAEVSLVFSNEEQRLPVPYDEIEIRRILFREGGSEYQLNRTSCRLKDIFDLFRDTGLGANAYTVIEQRMVDGILSERAEERRLLFEEAAGIGRYKDRRKAAQRRLDAAEADLARLEDLITEVDSKVRSLGRQRRRAQRYAELRARRLALEVTLALQELEVLRAAFEETVARLDELSRLEPASKAELSAAEADLERRRLEVGEAARTRSVAAARLEEIGRHIAERDRELAVAAEREAHAARRLEQLGTERYEIRAQLERLGEESVELEAERAAAVDRLETLSGALEAVQARQQLLREEVLEARRMDEQFRRLESELSRKVAEAEAAAARADARAAEGAARLRRLERERAELQAEIAAVDEQGDLFAERTGELEQMRAARRAERDEIEGRLEALRLEEAEARLAFAEVEDEANLLAGQIAALEALERDHHGFQPVVAAVLAAAEELDGVLGPLPQFLRLDRTRAAQVEHALGSLLQVLVVRDVDAADRVRRWIEERGIGDGTAALITRDTLPRVEELLASVLFAGDPAAAPVLIGRRERLEELRRTAAAVEEMRAARRSARAELAERIVALEAELREREAAFQRVDLELRRAEADEAARADQRARLERHLTELDRQHAALVTDEEGARAEAAAARQERARLEAELASHRDAWQGRESATAEREAAWETVREEEAELRVACARAEALRAELDRRIEAARTGREQLRARLDALGREEAEHRSTLERIGSLRAEAGASLEELFRERDRVANELRALDEALAAATAGAEELEARVRALRRQGEGQVEERHRLELRRAEAEAAMRAVRERLEVEWGRPFDRLAADVDTVEGEEHALRAELTAIAADIERLGPINMLAIEEHEEESQRLAFLTEQRDDLVRAREDLQSAIRQINRTARELFLQTFEQIRANFAQTFSTLFQGGTCDLWLTDPDDPLESPIEITASPVGKRTQRIHLLSGGERALTSLALLFAIYLVKPSPFCILDEVDAPLDEANVGRFISMLQEFKADTQFIVITHNPRTMEAADWIYGVTMEEPGVSSIVGVSLAEAEAVVGGAV